LYIELPTLSKNISILLVTLLKLNLSGSKGFAEQKAIDLVSKNFYNFEELGLMQFNVYFPNGELFLSFPNNFKNKKIFKTISGIAIAATIFASQVITPLYSVTDKAMTSEITVNEIETISKEILNLKQY